MGKLTPLAVERLRAGLEHHDTYGAQPDDTPVMLIAHNDEVLYELPHKDGQLALGDLRDLLACFDGPNVGDGTGDAAIAIAEHAFRAGCEAFEKKSHWASVNDLWDNYEPPEHIRALS